MSVSDPVRATMINSSLREKSDNISTPVSQRSVFTELKVTFESVGRVVSWLCLKWKDVPKNSLRFLNLSIPTTEVDLVFKSIFHPTYS